MGEKQLFDSLEFTLTPGQRIGLLGVNGSGKTTLIRLMNGEIQPDSGTIKRAANLRLITFSQTRDTLIPTQTLSEALCPVGDMVDYRGRQVHITGWAKRFLFEPDQLPTLISNLSGGEKARVLIANLMLEPADILLLDEPTNDLDIPSLEVLESALLEFPGAIVLVTHDRFMLERIATEFIGLDDAGGIKHFMTYKQWNDHRKKKNSKQKSPKGTGKQKPKSTVKKLSFTEKHEYKNMEQSILEAEAEVERLEAMIATPELATDHQQATKTYQSLSHAQDKVKELYSRWAELEAIQNGEG